MDSGFYAACAGLRAQSQALEVSAHNLANVNTPGFRGLQTSFQSQMAESGPVPNVRNSVLNLATNNYGVLEGTHLDRTAGNLQATGNPLDVGIQGGGFFAVETAAGTRYTRAGNFQVSSAGLLVTAAGDPVLGAPGLGARSQIHVPAGPVAIAADGTLSVKGAVAGSIRVVEFAPGTQLIPEGETLLAAPEGSAQAAGESSLRQGTLETSNVNSIQSVVTLIGVQRQAEMLQRAINVFDTEMNRIASTDLAKV